MINPAQYTQVLQQASDPQLMQMLKRPDKIPSQFVVAEINRRQSMRQAAMAERQRQAGVQEMMTAQQAMPQQQAMMPQQQAPQPQPAQMREGGMVSNAQKLSELSSQLSNLVGGEGQSSGNITNLLSNNGGGGLYNLSQPAYRPVQRPVAFPAQLFGGFDQGFNRLQGARGMSSGGAAKAGPNLLTALGMNTNAPGPERYGIPPFDPNRETVSEYNFRVNKARRDKMAMERMAIADAAMRTDADIQRPDDTAAGLRDAEMFMSTTGRSGDVEDLGSQASGVPSEASRRDGGVKDPFFKFGGVNLGNIFSDGSPADILKVLQGTGETVSGPEKRGLAAERRRPGGDDKGPALTATSGGRNDPTRTSPAQRAADEAALANREASFPSPAIVTPEKESSVTKRENAIPGGPIGPEPGATNQVETEAKGPKTALEVVKEMQQAAAADVEATTGGIKDSQQSGGVGTLPALPGDDALKPITVGGSGSTTPSTDKGGINNTGQQPPETTGDKTEKPNPFAITGETKSFTQIAQESNKEILGLNDTVNKLRTQANEDQQKQLTGYKSDLDALMKAQKDLMGVLDKNSMTPENRIFRAMIDGGLALAGSKNANFLQAVAESTGKGLETFDRLNAEQKKNLFDKYSAAVDFAKAKVDISQGINRMQNEINQGQTAIASGMTEQARSAADALQTAAKLDFDAAMNMSAEARAERGMVLKEDSQDLAREIFGFDQTKFAFNKSIAERGQAVKDLLANVTLFDTISKTNQADRKLDIMASGLDIQREELDFRKVSKEIDQQLEAMKVDQPPDAVAKLEFMKKEFGSEGLKEILLGREKSTTGDVTEDDILKAATDMYNADPNALIPGVKENDPQAAINYYANALRTTFGKSGGGSPTGPVDDTLEFED